MVSAYSLATLLLKNQPMPPGRNEQCISVAVMIEWLHTSCHTRRPFEFTVLLQVLREFLVRRVLADVYMLRDALRWIGVLRQDKGLGCIELVQSPENVIR
jgi:hypothetical protein